LSVVGSLIAPKPNADTRQSSLPNLRYSNASSHDTIRIAAIVGNGNSYSMSINGQKATSMVTGCRPGTSRRGTAPEARPLRIRPGHRAQTSKLKDVLRHLNEANLDRKLGFVSGHSRNRPLLLRRKKRIVNEDTIGK
jgi:hypothetical protein